MALFILYLFRTDIAGWNPMSFGAHLLLAIPVFYLLTIAGQRKGSVRDDRKEKLNIYSRERAEGEFRRVVNLPDDADPESAPDFADLADYDAFEIGTGIAIEF